jgi:hypothetical protein
MKMNQGGTVGEPEVPFRVVGLLSDCKGAYGIGIYPSAWIESFIRSQDSDLLDEEIDERIEDNESISEAIKPDEYRGAECIDEKTDEPIVDAPLLLRPDLIKASEVFPNKRRYTLLHALTNKCWLFTFEWELLGLMQTAALARNESFIELEKERRQARRPEYMKPESRKLYRQIRGGQRKRQLIVFNGMLKQLIAEAADPAALQLARRFHPVVRENIYRAAAISQRAKQLIEVFPALGVAIYCPVEETEYWEKAADAAQMVERGVKLSQIAGLMQVPMSARRLKPAVADLFICLPPWRAICRKRRGSNDSGLGRSCAKASIPTMPSLLYGLPGTF